ncbi:hypothetical protein [Noviherbaspirillum galbum]|uniref:Integrase n=1 Tax=Noviherbaspirillum galbum TaxID=2709383 RepID=A0A6B3SRP9_9BURK|nr:hypothetical protein [Noviherbaspirillum galbum]NEX63447.1 hypothetical protein [Noviherbaspirillum galbum]
MKTGNLREFTFGIQTDLVTSASNNYRIPSWPPSFDWPVVIDAQGAVVSRWSDSRWDLTPWAGYPTSIKFSEDGPLSEETIDDENAELLRMIAAWFIWGSRSAQKVTTFMKIYSTIKPIVDLCTRNGISAAQLMQFPKVFEQVPGVMAQSSYGTAIMYLHRLYDGRSSIGFTIIDQNGLKRLAEVAPDHELVQTPYIPPRIWTYQVKRLHECLTDFIGHREKIESCFRFCLDSYIEYYGSLEASLKTGGTISGSPFNLNARYRKNYRYIGTFPEIAARFGIADLLSKWVVPRSEELTVSDFSTYFSLVTCAGMMYIANFTLQRSKELSTLRTSCLQWEEDEKLGRVPIICGETTKTDPDADARWVASPSVEPAIQALTTMAQLRMVCDQGNPSIRPSPADQDDPYLASTATEPWGSACGHARRYNVRGHPASLSQTMQYYTLLLDPDQIRITTEDLEVARRLTPNLQEDKFAVGKVWPLGWHQYRRTGAVNMFASGIISDSTMQQQMKHSSRLMPLYYGRHHGRLHFNKEVEKAVVLAMYQAQAALIKSAVNDDRFVSPHVGGNREVLAVNVLGAKDMKDLAMMVKKGTVTFREHRLGGCMKAGVCEYGGIESVARCAGADSAKPCVDVLYDRAKEPQVRADYRRNAEEMKRYTPESPRYQALAAERKAMENYFNVISA